MPAEVTYEADGQLATKTDRNGNTTAYLYDIHGNLLSRTMTSASVGSATVSYTYDNNGNTLTMTDGTGTTTRVYDSFNRTTSKTVPYIGTSTYVYDLTIGLDTGCTAETTTDPNGNITKKVYDRVGRISEVIADGMTTVYHYNDNGSVQSVIYSDGSREDYTYTNDNHLDTLTNTKADSTIIDSYSYTYDAAHNMLTKVDARGTTAYTYDSLNRLLTVTEPSGKTTGYTYDASGNRLTETDILGTDITVITYTYDSQNRLTGTVSTVAESTVVTGDEGTAAITTIGAAAVTSTVVYTYDNNGNQVSKTMTAYIEGVAQTPVADQVYTYDLFNQLASTITSAGMIVLNTYNGDGLRVGKSVNGSLTRYLYEYDKVVLEANYLGVQTRRNVYGINLITRQVGADTFSYMYNGHADVTALVGTNGNVVATYYYDAFGNILAQTGTVNNNILYAGYQYDKETGLYYLNARMYDPLTARFMQEDTYTGEYSDPLSLNLYTYCKNEPLMYSDPTGHRQVEGYEIGGHTTHNKSTDGYSQNVNRSIKKQQQAASNNQNKLNFMENRIEQQSSTITSAAKSTINDSAMISFPLDPDSSTYLDAGQYQQTLAWLDQERINRGGSILISGLQLTTDPTANGYNVRDLATFQAINKITCFNGDIGSTDKLLGALENQYTALGIDSSNALLLDAQGMKNLSAVAADRNKAVNGGTGFNFFKFQEENLFGSGIASSVGIGFAYGALMTVYAGSGFQQTSQTNSDIIDAAVRDGNEANTVDRSAKSPVSQSEWNDYFCEQYGAENVECETADINEGGTGKGMNNPVVSNSAKTGQEAHRQLELEGIDKWIPEQTIELPNGTTVRKDGVGRLNSNEVRIIKPDTPTGIKAAEKRAELMRKYGYEPTIDYYDPTDFRFQPGSPTYIGPKK